MLFRGILGTDYSGTLGGLVASHCANSKYFRAHAIPTNPNTSRQQAIREAVDVVRANWQELDPAFRAMWEGFAANLRRPNRIGQTAPRTGYNEYIRWATPRLYTNAVFASSIEAVECTPVGPEPVFAEPPVGVIIADSFHLTWSNTDPWINPGSNIIIVWISATRASTDPPAARILSPTVNYFRGPWLMIAAGSGEDGELAFTLPRGLTPGESVRWKARISTLNNGYSAEYQGSAIAT